MNHKEFRRLQNDMDQAGMMTVIKTIRRHKRKVEYYTEHQNAELGTYYKKEFRFKYTYRYEVIINGGIVRCYNARRSAKNYLVKLFREKLNINIKAI